MLMEYGYDYHEIKISCCVLIDDYEMVYGWTCFCQDCIEVKHINL